MRKLAVLFVVLCACGGDDGGTPQDAGVDGHPDAMADAMPDASPECVDVDDGIACTQDTCDPETGVVTHTPDDTSCNDDVACTTDTCSATAGCVYTPTDTACDDGVDCTVDACDATNGCTHTTMDSLCEGDNASCTVPHCDATAGCSEVPTNAMCDDGASCSTDTCDPTDSGANATTGCVYQLDDSACADTAECSIDACSPGTTGADAATGCLYTADATACDANATCSNAFDCTCNSGYAGDGLTCTMETTTCDPLTNPAHGTVDVNDTTATYTCDAGYGLSGTATRTCGGDGHWSDAAPTCVATVFVVRLGDGAAALTNAATPVFLEERLSSDGTLVRTINLPTAASGTQAQFTMAGTSTAEGQIARSVDGRYDVLAGYALDAGTTGAPSTTNLSTDTAPINRVVARIDATGAFDTSTRLLNAFSGNSPRGAATTDGTAFWVTGNGSSGSGGMWYVPFGSAGADAVHLDGTNLTQAAIADGQLYESATTAINAVGTGLPTTAGQTVAAAMTVGSVRSFVFLDTDATPGADTAYLAVDASGAVGVVNVQKWTFDGTAWNKVAAFAPQLADITTASQGATRGVGAWVDGGTVHVVATLAGTSANKLVGFVDDSDTPTVTVLATADANTVYRGTAPTPNVAP